MDLSVLVELGSSHSSGGLKDEFSASRFPQAVQPWQYHTSRGLAPSDVSVSAPLKYFSMAVGWFCFCLIKKKTQTNLKT